MFKPIYHQEKWLEEEEDLDAEKPKKGYATKTVGKHFDELTKILNSAILDGDKRTAFAVLSVLFKVFKRPSLSLIHAGLETLWNRKEISLFLRSIIDLSLNDKHGSYQYRQSIALSHCAYFLTQKNYAQVKELFDSDYSHNDMFNDCPLIHSFYGQACFILSGEEENKSIRKELLNSAIRSLENTLRIAGWAEMDETVYILATCYFRKGNIDESKRVLAKYASYEKKNICALRMKAEFLKAYGTPKDAEDLLCSYIDWAAEDPSSDRAYTQCFNLITSRKEGLAINAEAVEKLSRAALGRLTNCNPYDWRPWANLTMLLKQGITIEPVWQHKTWRVIHLTPPKGTTDAELEVDYVLAKAAFCEVVCGTDDSLTKRWVSRLHCRESFEEVKDYAKYYEATAGSEVYRIITYDLRCGDIDYDDDDDDDDVETFPMSQQSPVPLKKAKNEHKDKTTSH